MTVAPRRRKAADAIAQAARDTTGLDAGIGTVLALVGGTVLTIAWRGGTYDGIPFLSSYATPAAGHQVAVIAFADQLLVLGRTSAPTS